MHDWFESIFRFVAQKAKERTEDPCLVARVALRD
jgi:hypothetical protein